MRVICGVAVILVSAEDVSERVICGAAVILVFAEEVFLSGICGAAVILLSAEDVSQNHSVAQQLYWRLQRRCL